MTVKLIVARHGNTFNKGDVILRVGSRTNLPLTQEGIAQGLRLGENLRSAGLCPTRLFSAPLLRTLMTCEEAVKVFNVPFSIEQLDFLTELDYGEYDGLPETDVLRRIGEIETATQQPLVTDAEKLVEIGRTVLKRWDKEAVLPKAWKFLQPRVDSLGNQWRDFSERLIQTANQGSVSLAVTSNGIARFALDILPIDAKRPDSVKLSTGAFGLFIWNGKYWSLGDWDVK
ncbi:MAG: histidine phosphatase family protein [Thermoguttaceae bacterium]|nr:histidine phosphatase family protein [Thermoguttaceae bacterium]